MAGRLQQWRKIMEVRVIGEIKNTYRAKHYAYVNLETGKTEEIYFSKKYHKYNINKFARACEVIRKNEIAALNDLDQSSKDRIFFKSKIHNIK